MLRRRKPGEEQIHALANQYGATLSSFKLGREQTMTVSTKASIASSISFAVCIALGWSVYQREFRGWTIFWFVAGGLALASFSTLVIWLSAQTQTEIQDQQQKTREAEKAESGDTFSMAKASMAKLDEYYVINKSQAKWSFFASIFAVTAGLIVLVLTIQKAKTGLSMAAGSLSGALLEFIAGGFFYIYNKSLQQTLLFYTNLTRLQDTMLAVQLCKELADSSNQNLVMSELIRDVMKRAMRTGPLELQGGFAPKKSRPASEEMPAPFRRKKPSVNPAKRGEVEVSSAFSPQ